MASMTALRLLSTVDMTTSKVILNFPYGTGFQLTLSDLLPPALDCSFVPGSLAMCNDVVFDPKWLYYPNCRFASRSKSNAAGGELETNDITEPDNWGGVCRCQI